MAQRWGWAVPGSSRLSPGYFLPSTEVVHGGSSHKTGPEFWHVLFLLIIITDNFASLQLVLPWEKHNGKGNLLRLVN